ncbi:MAG TPA: hypothetical protein VD968_16190, partial [Pyrinomonadaceae bacterium]|nr:hypothetical protein [Pyrinomonadaceae bacterium]
MTLAVLFLVGAALAGAALVRRALRGLPGGAEQLAWGTVLGWALSALCVYAAARWQGRLTHAQVVWAAALAWLAAAALSLPELRRLRGGGWRLKITPRRHAGLALVLVVFAPVLWHLFSTHMLPREAGGVYSGGSSWYDMALHAALASSFLYGENFPPVYTPLPPEPLHYPFVPDFQTAILMRTGVGMSAALVWTALPLALATVAIFYSAALRVARSQRAAALATFLFLLNGGLGFLYFFSDWRASGRTLTDFWNSNNVNYANAWERGIHWTNLVADTMLPQRTSLYGLPLGLMVFTLFAVVWRRAGGDARPSESRLLLAAGLMTGLLPLFHPHTYAAVVVVGLLLSALRPRRAWFAFWAPALLLAAPRLLAVAVHAAEGGFVRLQPGWMGQGEASWPLYMLRNFGLALLLAGLAWLAAPRHWRVFYLAFAGLFALSLILMVTPNAFDNIKLMHYWHAANCVLVGSWLARLWAARRRPPLHAFALRAAVAVVVLASVASGLLALRSEARARARLFDDEEIAAADFARERTAPRSLFLAAPAINQPVLCLAGRPVLRGPTPWLW